MSRRVTNVGLMLFAAVSWAGSARGQNFDCGSTGGFGAINVTSGTTTLTMPADGKFNCTTIDVANGGTLRFNPNPLNTPVYLLAQGDITINGVVHVNGSPGTSSPPVGGKGGPGGFEGGTPGFGGNFAPGAGNGPGAGLGGDAGCGNSSTSAGMGSYGTRNGAATKSGPTYGSPLLIPMVGGSGGGGTTGAPGTGGGGGGGAILLASNTRITISGTGAVQALGGTTSSINGLGSGGAIRLIAPAIAGSGSVNVAGGGFCISAGFGRIRVDTIDRTNMTLGFNSPGVVSVGALMVVFPAVVPRLDIVEAAGTLIPEGNPNPVVVLLPFGSSGSRTVTVQGRDFTGNVPINVVVTPESGDPVTYPATINMDSNPSQVVVPVDIPVNTACRIGAWTQ